MQLPEGWDGIVPQVRIGGVAQTGFTEFKKSTTCYRIVFKIRRLVTIPVLKWEERLDGTVIPGEDWKITATPQGDPFAKVVTATITSGQALLTLTPGTWTVAETVKSGWTPLTPATVTRVVDQYQGTGAINPIVFKNREPACHPKITVTKVGYGTNANGEREPLGTIAGWKYTVSRADGATTSIVKTTGGDGRAVFDGLYPGVYKVTETVQSGWKVLGDNPVTVVLMDCETVESDLRERGTDRRPDHLRHEVVPGLGDAVQGHLDRPARLDDHRHAGRHRHIGDDHHRRPRRVPVHAGPVEGRGHGLPRRVDQGLRGGARPLDR